MTRWDIPPEDVARRWLEGETIAALALSYTTGENTIKRRLDYARQALPDLPWDKRNPPRRSAPRSDLTRYVTMKDGRKGAMIGSVIKARSLRNR